MTNSCTAQTVTGGACPASACSVCVRTQTLSTGAGTYTAREVTVVVNQTLPTLSGIAPLVGGSSYGTIPVAATSTMRTEAAGAPPAGGS